MNKQFQDDLIGEMDISEILGCLTIRECPSDGNALQLEYDIVINCKCLD